MAKYMAFLSDGIVRNVLWCDDNEPDTDALIDPGDRAVGIGDTYRDGKFYRDGVEILTPLEEAQKRIAQLEAQNADQAAALTAIYTGEVSA